MGGWGSALDVVCCASFVVRSFFFPLIDDEAVDEWGARAFSFPPARDDSFPLIDNEAADEWGTRASVFGSDVAGFCGREDLGVGAEVSRVTSAAGLSSRSPRKAAWRTRLSDVHVAKRTCATSSGRTQRAPRRWSAGSSLSKG